MLGVDLQEVLLYKCDIHGHIFTAAQKRPHSFVVRFVEHLVAHVEVLVVVRLVVPLVVPLGLLLLRWARLSESSLHA